MPSRSWTFAPGHRLSDQAALPRRLGGTQGDLLFEIDPRRIRQLDNAQSQVDLNEASLKLAKATYERDRVIAATVTGAVSQQQIDQDVAAVEEAAARIKSAKASTEVYKLNVEFCRVTSPIDGQISRYYLDARQPRQHRSNAADHDCLARSHVCLFRHG